MSYATDVKVSLTREIPKNLCCRKSQIIAFLLSSAFLDDEGRVCTDLAGEDVTSYFCRLVTEAYRVDPKVTTRRGGGGARRVIFSSPSAVRTIESFADPNGIRPWHDFKCKECETAFLQGLFLACGHPCTPEKELRLDLTPLFRADLIAAFLAAVGLQPLVASRGSREVLYFRSMESIGDFFGKLGLVDYYFDLQNEYFRRELSNLTNRQTNCTFGNISRSVETQREQIRVLRAMKDRNLLSLLPDDLKSTAEMRLAYESYSLSQLAMVSVPPLTKSGLHHRLQKIMEFASKLNL